MAASEWTCTREAKQLRKLLLIVIMILGFQFNEIALSPLRRMVSCPLLVIYHARFSYFVYFCAIGLMSALQKWRRRRRMEGEAVQRLRKWCKLL